MRSYLPSCRLLALGCSRLRMTIRRRRGACSLASAKTPSKIAGIHTRFARRHSGAHGFAGPEGEVVGRRIPEDHRRPHAFGKVFRFSPDCILVLPTSIDHTVKSWDEHSGECQKALAAITGPYAPPFRAMALGCSRLRATVRRSRGACSPASARRHSRVTAHASCQPSYRPAALEHSRFSGTIAKHRVGATSSGGGCRGPPERPFREPCQHGCSSRAHAWRAAPAAVPCAALGQLAGDTGLNLAGKPGRAASPTGRCSQVLNVKLKQVRGSHR